VFANSTGIILYAQPDIARNISKVEHAEVRHGDYNLGNKSSAAIRLNYRHVDAGNNAGEETTVVAFVASHLQASADKYKERNGMWRTIVENLVFESIDLKTGRYISSSSPLSDSHEEAATPLLSSTRHDDTQSRNNQGIYARHSHLFVAGDLNYRATDSESPSEDHKNFPPPRPFPSSSHPMPDVFSSLLHHDQLSRERTAKNTLHHLTEAAIRFDPTYKFSEPAQRNAKTAPSSLGGESHEEDVWVEQRTPSWCDRILYLDPKNQSQECKPTIELYDALAVQPTSDHRPVLMKFSLPLTPLTNISKDDEVDLMRGFTLNPNWKRKRDTSRLADLVAGVGMYTVMTWEGATLAIGTVAAGWGGWYLIKSIL